MPWQGAGDGWRREEEGEGRRGREEVMV